MDECSVLSSDEVWGTRLESIFCVKQDRETKGAPVLVLVIVVDKPPYHSVRQLYYLGSQLLRGGDEMSLSLKDNIGWIAGLVVESGLDGGICRSPVDAVAKENRIESDVSCMSVSRCDKIPAQRKENSQTCHCD